MLLVLTTPWLKVLIDLWEHRGRTVVVALAIAVGVYAVGVVLNAREILVREYRTDQTSALLASAVVYTSPFEDDLARSVAGLPLVAAAEGRTIATGRAIGLDGSSQDLSLTAVPDFGSMTVDALSPQAGRPDPGRREVVVEGASLASLGVRIGDTLTIELDNAAVRDLRVVGVVHDPQQVGPSLTGSATAYITPETMASLGYSSAYTELRIRATDPAQDEAHIVAVLDQVEDYLRSSGRMIYSRRIITESLADPFIDSIVLILSAFGLVILLLSGFLVVNAMSALITQQIPQIGVMKLVGARRMQIMALYLATVLIYGALAVAVALPMASVTAQLLMRYLVEPLLNVRVQSYAIPVHLLLAQAAVGLLLPLVAGLSPVIQGTRITTREALNSVGPGGASYGRGLIERGLAQLQRLKGFERPMLLAARNMLRHKGRLVQTLVVLVFGTALFISVLSVRASVDATLAAFMQFHKYDVSVVLEQPEMASRLLQAAAEVPGVEAAEMWSSGAATRVRPDDSESSPFSIVAAPPETRFMAPELIAGRWLPAEATATPNAVVINSDLVDKEPDLRIGGEVVLEIGGREGIWRIAGIVGTESRGPTAYVNQADYAYAARTAGEGNRLVVQMAPEAGLTQERLAAQLQTHLEDRGLKVQEAETAGVTQTQNNLLFTIVVAFLILMALLLAAVGGLGLSTTMSINMMERVREVGVLRAIGASNASVRHIVLAEGIAMATVSWLAGALLSIGLSPWFSDQLGLALIKMPLQYNYSIVGAVVWFFILLGIAALASLAPARNAVRLTVREVLAYE